MDASRVLIWGVLLLACWCGSSAATGPKAEPESVPLELLDLEVWDQDGRTLRFKSDVIGDRVAAIVPFYTNCTTAYPILIFVFGRLQELLGDRLGKDVVLVSVSVDPRTDVPSKLKAFATRKKARPGWVFISGERGTLARILAGIEVQYMVGEALSEQHHIPLTLVGDPCGKWKRFYGYPSPEVLHREIMQVLTSRDRLLGR